MNSNDRVVKQEASDGPVSQSGRSASPVKPVYLPPPAQPVIEAEKGVRYDFNLGARVFLPTRELGRWRVTLEDMDTGNILFHNENTGAFISSSKRYYVKFRIAVIDIAEDGTETLIVNHEYDPIDKEILIQLPVGTLGDTLAWFPYVNRFAEERNARVTCLLSGLILPLLKDSYPHLTLMTSDEAEAKGCVSNSYATYCLGLFFDDKDCLQQPTDFRFVGLHKTAAYILGVSPHEEAPRFQIADDTSPLGEPYVCIAVQASTQCKYWNNPQGWDDIIKFLKQKGYRVICIDQKSFHGSGIVWNHIPHGAEDQTGNRPLSERVRWLRHAKAFIGLSSGLAWLAWGAGIPVVMISGFTHPTNEFETPYRVINWHACNSCWNDPAYRFDHNDFLWCPRHAGTNRQFECTRLITGQHVIHQLEKFLL